MRVLAHDCASARDEPPMSSCGMKVSQSE
jgi:hypothetical protein